MSDGDYHTALCRSYECAPDCPVLLSDSTATVTPSPGDHGLLRLGSTQIHCTVMAAYPEQGRQPVCVQVDGVGDPTLNTFYLDDFTWEPS